MERFARQGITDKEKVIIEMEKEIDMYREKLRGYKVSMKMDKSIKELDESLAEAAGDLLRLVYWKLKKYTSQSLMHCLMI